MDLTSGAKPLVGIELKKKEKMAAISLSNHCCPVRGGKVVRRAALRSLNACSGVSRP